MHACCDWLIMRGLHLLTVRVILGAKSNVGVLLAAGVPKMGIRVHMLSTVIIIIVDVGGLIHLGMNAPVLEFSLRTGGHSCALIGLPVGVAATASGAGYSSGVAIGQLSYIVVSVFAGCMHLFFVCFC